MYDAFDIIRENRQRPAGSIHTAMRNVSPVLEVKPRRVGGATHQGR